MTFLDDNFLLGTPTAVALFHSVASRLPIIDYHSHLSPQVIADNQPFASLFDAWLSGDHYKWRAMRAAGVAEALCTGTSTPREKFLAFAKTVPQTLRNPLYHWTHLELQRYFGIHDLLNANTAEKIWEQANAQLATESFLPQSILRRFHVHALCTTDDPADDLPDHRRLQAATDLPFRVYPTYRPDTAFAIDQPQRWNAWCDRLATTTNIDIARLPDLLQALKQRHDDFHALGCRLSDHGLSYCFSMDGTAAQAESLFEQVRVSQNGESRSCPENVAPEQVDRFGGFLLRQLAIWDHQKNWTKQLHLGARRNNNSRLFKTLGPDIGCDSIGDWNQVDRLVSFLDDLDENHSLPKVIVYNLNPADNYAIAAAIGNFQDGTIPGKLQMGSGWWFLDQKEAMQWQMNALSNLGLFSRFVGMLTDSRSFLSFPRHEYFRRVLCDLIGTDVQRGEIPDDHDLLSDLIQGICFRNARQSLGLELPAISTDVS